MFDVLLLLPLLLASAGSASAALRYVDANSASPTPPYTNWATAARVIQEAVDAASPGDTVLVTNRVYRTGGLVVTGVTAVTSWYCPTGITITPGSWTNRVALTKVIRVQSASGPAVTRIEGSWSSANPVRCGFLTNGASLSGFTLSNGLAQVGAGIWCLSTNALVSNCIMVSNRFGGAFSGTLNDCVLFNNEGPAAFIPCVPGGGGALGSTLNNCLLTGNICRGGSGIGGGSGGGAQNCTLNNCLISSNVAAVGGGGASYSTLNNCILTGNTTAIAGGAGAYACVLNNCTVVGNSARGGSGGAENSTLNNCVVFSNTASYPPPFQNYYSSTLNYCCTTPFPANGVGNITNEPAFVNAAAGNYRLRPGSPCIDAGTNLSAILTTDLDGRPRPVDGNGDGLAAFDIGAYEYRALYVWQGSPSPMLPYATWATAASNVQDAVDAALAGDEIVVTNGIYASGGRAVYGTMTNRVAVDKPVTVRSVNGPQFTVIQGRQVPGTTNGDGAIRCVYLTSGASLLGFTLTSGATRTNEDSWDARRGGGLFCESTDALAANCTLTGNSAAYSGGAACSGTLENCTVWSNSAVWMGGGTYSSALNNCALIGNSARTGGGATLDSLNNCTLTGNSARDEGGGAWGGNRGVPLTNCTFTGNSATYGGAAWGGDLNNCTLAGNWATNAGGGALVSRVNNCIVYFNTAPNGANHLEGLNYCCTTPMPTNGVGNITNAPLFVDLAGGNLRLQSNSPCINAGLNRYAHGSTDKDGNPRIVSGTVDIGAYEFQGPGSVISYAWLQRYGLPTDGSADFTDPDRDGLNTWQEWRCQTDPTNALSALRLLLASRTATNVTVTWQSVAGVSYFLEQSTNLAAIPPFTPLATNLPGQPGTTTFTDTNAGTAPRLFYRVGVGN